MEQIKKLDEQKSKLLDDARQEALRDANAAVAVLNELGFTYKLVEGGRSNSTAPSSRTGTRTVKDMPCPICGFKTNPPHDKRSHRIQDPKKPYTDAELKAKGLSKVS